MSKNALLPDMERKRNLIDTLYHHSDLSVEAISNQVDMNLRQVQDIIDSIARQDSIEILAEQSKTPASEIMTTDVATLERTRTVLDASVLMAKKGVGCVVVMANRKPYGIITERDIVRRIPDIDKSLMMVTLEEFASRPIIFVSPAQTVIEVADMMTREKVRRIPVIENEKLMGIVTTTDLARFLSSTRRPGLAGSILSAISREE